MFENLSRQLLHLLRVPPAPEPPFGAPGSVRVFRAGRNFFRLRLYGWWFKQALALAGFLFWLFALMQFEKFRNQPEASAPEPAPPQMVETRGDDTEDSNRITKSKRPKHNRTPQETFKEISRHTPAFVLMLLWILKGVTLITYLAQLPITYALLRLDYDQRWYVVTDRSLRLRTGVWSVREMTMSFANLQQITVTQGPLQRLLGLADVRVQSAGGGGMESGKHGAAQHSLHTGYFHAVDNAEEIRDLITERLRQFRESGLGDPDEKHHAGLILAPVTRESTTLAAATELLAEAKALRQALG